MKKKWIAFAAVLMLAASLGSWLTTARPVTEAASKDTGTSHIMLGMLGEVRYTLAAFIWLKADYYHHEYELYNKDWKKNDALMSLIRLVTILDPHFVQAYDFGSYHLAKNFGKYDEAYAFLNEGLSNNPESFELLFQKGFLLTSQKKFREALVPLLKADKLPEKKSYLDEMVIRKIWVLSRITYCYAQLGEWEKAYEYGDRWYRIAQSPLAKENLETILDQMIHAYSEAHNWEKALEYCKIGHELSPSPTTKERLDFVEKKLREGK